MNNTMHIYVEDPTDFRTEHCWICGSIKSKHEYFADCKLVSVPGAFGSEAINSAGERVLIKSGTARVPGAVIDADYTEESRS